LGKFCNGRCWYILWTLGPFYGHLVHIFCDKLVYVCELGMMYIPTYLENFDNPDHELKCVYR
jgi:hypothetical protein